MIIILRGMSIQIDTSTEGAHYRYMATLEDYDGAPDSTRVIGFGGSPRNAVNELLLSLGLPRLNDDEMQEAA